MEVCYWRSESWIITQLHGVKTDLFSFSDIFSIFDFFPILESAVIVALGVFFGTVLVGYWSVRVVSGLVWGKIVVRLSVPY
jgi:hypothetical protein